MFYFPYHVILNKEIYTQIIICTLDRGCSSAIALPEVMLGQWSALNVLWAVSSI